MIDPTKTTPEKLAEMNDSLITDNTYLRAELTKAHAESETERLRLAACGVAALGYFKECRDEYRSDSLDHTLRLYAEKERLRLEVAAKQARIDELMLEHCPDEMTEEQVATYTEHQKPVQP